MNVHNTFRRPPGRFLNVLCTFNLRPVPTGLVAQTDGKHWEKKQEYSIAKKRILNLSSFRINLFWASTSKAPPQLCHWTTSQKHLGIIFNYWLTFDDHSYSILRKTLKNVGFPRKLQNTLPRPVLITVYKTFLRALSISWYTHHNQAYKTSNTKKNTLQRLFSCKRDVSRYLIWKTLPRVSEPFENKRYILCNKLCSFLKFSTPPGFHRVSFK